MRSGVMPGQDTRPAYSRYIFSYSASLSSHEYNESMQFKVPVTCLSSGCFDGRLTELCHYPICRTTYAISGH